jgi:hypothetical protein
MRKAIFYKNKGGRHEKIIGGNYGGCIVADECFL